MAADFRRGHSPEPLGKVDLRNLTDQRNWIHNGDAYTASALIIQDLPLRGQGYVKVKF